MLLFPEIPGVGAGGRGWKARFGAAMAEKDLCWSEVVSVCLCVCVSGGLHSPHLRLLR